MLNLRITRESVDFRCDLLDGVMSSLYDYDEFLACLFELESALILTAHEKCQDLQTRTHLSAAIFALLRATSLFRASLSLLESGLMDACDVVRRSCWEAWMLGYEFRLVDSSSHAARWHVDTQKHWEADRKKVAAFEASLGLMASTRGSDYGGLSQVTHPTKSAAENSLVTVTAIHGNSDFREHLDRARDIVGHEDAPGFLYLLIWTIAAEAAEMISLSVKLTDLPKAQSFFRAYEKENPSCAPAVQRS